MIAREKHAGEHPVSGAEKASPSDDAGAGPSPFEPLIRHFAELQMLVGHYLRARTIRLRPGCGRFCFGQSPDLLA